jgi:hypothetical protein
VALLARVHVSRRSLVLLAGALVLAFPGVALATIKSDTARIRRGLSGAQSASWLTASDTSRYRATLALAVRDTERLPRGRVTVIASLLNEIALEASSLTSPRALALFGMLETNLQYLETHVLPRSQIDVADADGVLYRWFPGRGFQIHPLADFGALNAAVNRNDPIATRAIADALAARGVPRGATLRWEYYFPFETGRPPWVSGMAQAVAAQAFGRAASLLGDPSLGTIAARAYAAVPAALLRKLAAGPWIRLYSFSRAVVLNAQLQTILSLLDYVDATGDTNADQLATRMTVAAQKLLPKFDTGYWSLYALGGPEAPLSYQRFVTQLLTKLAQRTDDPGWQSAAQRFASYTREPPRIEPEPQDAPVTLYPQPADGYLDAVTVTFTLSKHARVTLSAGGKTVSATFDYGVQSLTWRPGTLPPGTYAGQLTAVDLAGNKTTIALPQPFVVAWDTLPPQVQAQYADGILSWQAIDPGTPKLRLQLDLRDATGAVQSFDLGFHSVSGTANVTLPSGTWDATLTATNTARLSTAVPLGTIAVP